MRAPTLKPVFVGEPIPLVREDLDRLHQGNRTTTSIQRLRASHHRIAMLGAKGLDNFEIAAYTGYSPNRVAQLRCTPAMKELESSFLERQLEKESETLDPFSELLVRNALAAQRHIADHFAELDDKDELMPVRTALAVAADAADRIGYGKRSTTTTYHFDGDELERTIARYNKTIDSAPLQPTKTLPMPQPSRTQPQGAMERPLIRRRA